MFAVVDPLEDAISPPRAENDEVFDRKVLVDGHRAIGFVQMLNDLPEFGETIVD